MNNDNIGIDPSLIEQLDTSNVNNPEPQNGDVNKPPVERKPEKKPVNKVAFTLIILLLMGGIGYGIYWYLNTAKKKMQNRTVVKENVTVLNKYAYIGSVLSDDVNDYAIYDEGTKCNLDIKNVDLTKSGANIYNVVCSSTYSANIYVSDIPDEGQTQIVIKKVGDKVEASDFIKSSSLVFSFVGDVSTEQTGMYKVLLSSSDASSKYYLAEGTLVVLENDYTSYWGCESDADYYLLPFDAERKVAEKFYKATTTTFTTKEELLKSAASNTKTSVFDYSNNKISLYDEALSSTIGSEDNSIIKVILYLRANGYTCGQVQKNVTN